MESKSGISKFVLIPRIIAVVYIFFLLLFALDAGGNDLLQRIFSFVMNALPAILIAVCLALFWRRPKICGWVFLGVAVVFTVWFASYTQIDRFLIVSVPSVVIGVLFLISGHVPNKQKK